MSTIKALAEHVVATEARIAELEKMQRNWELDTVYWKERAEKAEAEVVKLKAQEIHLEKELAKAEAALAKSQYDLRVVQKYDQEQYDMLNAAEAALADVDPTLKFRSYQIRELSRELLDAEAALARAQSECDAWARMYCELKTELDVAREAIARVRALEGAVFTQSAQVSAADWNGWLDARLVREALDGPLAKAGIKPNVLWLNPEDVKPGGLWHGVAGIDPNATGDDDGPEK
jgi:chromosome segregation ATPase